MRRLATVAKSQNAVGWCHHLREGPAIVKYTRTQWLVMWSELYIALHFAVAKAIIAQIIRLKSIPIRICLKYVAEFIQLVQRNNALVTCQADSSRYSARSLNDIEDLSVHVDLVSHCLTIDLLVSFGSAFHHQFHYYVSCHSRHWIWRYIGLSVVINLVKDDHILVVYGAMHTNLQVNILWRVYDTVIDIVQDITKTKSIELVIGTHNLRIQKQKDST